MKKPKAKSSSKQKKLSEVKEIELLNSWIEAQKPGSGFNPLSLPPLSKEERRVGANSFPRYSGATLFSELPISKKTKDALRQSKFIEMTDIQRASLPHALCGRDILGAAKTGSGKTLAFVIPVLEKLYKERWGHEDGVGCIIISPTRELAGQLFDVLKLVGKYHGFSSGLLIGGRKDVKSEKERVNELNILVCTPGRLLQHMDETPYFDCSQLQVLVLDEADRILDVGFKKELNAIISQLPKRRQTFLFSATQTKSVQDLARLSLKDPEYISVHEESEKATPTGLQETAIIVSLDEKLEMLWSFIKAHLKSKILVFLSTRKQVKFVYEAFKKLRPGIPLMCLYGKMKLEKRLGVYSQFCEKHSVLFCTDVAARGLDFNRAVDWVVQVDCPENVETYIHRVGRTARYQSGGRSVLFLMPSETKMLEKLRAAKSPIQSIKANKKRLQPISGLLSALLVKYTELQNTAQRAFKTYLLSIHKQKDKEIFDVLKLPLDKFSASMGLPFVPKVRFLNKKSKQNSLQEKSSYLQPENSEKDDDLENPSEDLKPVNSEENDLDIPRKELDIGNFKEEKVDRGFLLEEDAVNEDGKAGDVKDIVPATRILKKKKLKINIHRPVGTRVVFDEEGKTLPPLARIADMNGANDSLLLDQDKKKEYYKKMREQLKQVDKEDKLLESKRRREKRIKEKLKRKRNNVEEEDSEQGVDSGSEEEASRDRSHKRSKIYFDSDNEDGEGRANNVEKGISASSISLEEQEALALKLLNSMHS